MANSNFASLSTLYSAVRIFLCRFFPTLPMLVLVFVCSLDLADRLPSITVNPLVSTIFPFRHKKFTSQFSTSCELLKEAIACALEAEQDHLGTPVRVV